MRTLKADPSVIDDAKDRLLWLLQFPDWQPRLDAVHEAYPRIKDQLPEWAWAHFVCGDRPIDPRRVKTEEERAFLEARKETRE